ncbi:hypothetical protein NVP1201B_44 [Vibrio phage 1.201.B._10N.286.55.F1]|nr:hypothetical protein NVP1201B_44 [Vibrio phage 1.201.B._10N.286.55.F1]
MAYSPSEKYPGAVDTDPDYQGGKFRDNNPSTTNNGSPLKAIDRNELLARDEAIMNDAGFEYSGVADTPQDSQLFKAYKASLGNGANLLSNHNFLIQTPDDSQPLPSATPTSYPPGYQIFSGVFANETTGITNLTYIDGRVSFSGGDLYFAVPNTGGVERLTQFAASAADFDGKPRTRGVSYALVGDEYRVTVGIDALEDESAVITPLGSVKFEQGSVATGHFVDVNSQYATFYASPNVNHMSSISWPVGATVSTKGRGSVGDGGEGMYIIKTLSDYGETPDGFIDIAVQGSKVAVRQIGMVLSFQSIGIIFDSTIIADQDTNVLALRALSNRLKTDYVAIKPWHKDIAINDTIQWRENDVDFKGAGMDLGSITMTDDTKFGFDLFAVAAGRGRYTLSNFTFNGKYQVKTRYDQDTDFENDANPIKAFSFDNIRFNGVYDAASDPLAGSTLLPTRGELNLLGIGLQLSTNYRTEVNQCEFDNNGIGLSSMGNTLSKYMHNRFQSNARHLHDERTLWIGSSFGLGAENIISQNDFLDATRIGGLSLINSFGVYYGPNNYHEHLDRNGVTVSPVMVYFENPSHMNCVSNHYNAFQSVGESVPFMRYFFNAGNAIGEASNNRMYGNRLTPFSNVLSAFVQVAIDDYDRRYPVVLHSYDNSNIFPEVNAPYVVRKGQTETTYFSYDNLEAKNILGGEVSDNSLLWIKDGSSFGWHLPSVADSAATPNLNLNLQLENYGLTDRFNLIIVADDNATGNGRLYIQVLDETGTIFNDFAFSGVTSITRNVVSLTGGATANKNFEIRLTDLSFSKVYYVAIEPA